MQRAPVAIRPAASNLSLHSGDASALIEAGRDQLREQNFGLAVSSFREALLAEPESAAANNGLGIAYASIGRDDLARRYFERALAFAPEDGSYRRNLDRLAGADTQGAEAAMAVALTEPVEVQIREQLQPASPAVQLRAQASSPVDYASAPVLRVALPAEVAAATTSSPVRLQTGVNGATLVTRSVSPAVVQAQIEVPSVSQPATGSRSAELPAVTPELKRMSRHEVRLTLRPASERLGERMRRDYLVQWTGEGQRAAVSADAASGEAAFRQAIGDARHRSRLSQGLSLLRRACVSVQAVAHSLFRSTRGSDQCLS